MARTSVIIPCWLMDDFKLKLAQRCIQSVRDTADVELILVDNGSSIGQNYLVEEADIYVRYPKNMGYVRAINSGFKLATKEYLVAGNDDFGMEDGWEEALINVFDRVPDAGISCPHTQGSPRPDTMWEEYNTPGGWWMIKKDIQEKVGLLDDRFFNVFADFDFIWRMKGQLKLRVISTPEVSVQHYGEATLKRFKDRTVEYNKGQWELLNKWKNHPDLPEHLKNFMELEEVDEWLGKNNEFSKSINYSA